MVFGPALAPDRTSYRGVPQSTAVLLLKVVAAFDRLRPRRHCTRAAKQHRTVFCAGRAPRETATAGYPTVGPASLRYKTVGYPSVLHRYSKPAPRVSAKARTNWPAKDQIWSLGRSRSEVWPPSVLPQVPTMTKRKAAPHLLLIPATVPRRLLPNCHDPTVAGAASSMAPRTKRHLSNLESPGPTGRPSTSIFPELSCPSWPCLPSVRPVLTAAV